MLWRIGLDPPGSAIPRKWLENGWSPALETLLEEDASVKLRLTIVSNSAGDASCNSSSISPSPSIDEPVYVTAE